MNEIFDFAGWATKNNLMCSDGRVILQDAFKHNDGKEVPLVWNHCHNDPFNVLGHAILENRPEGVYAYCSFNDSEAGKTGKELVKHGDIKSLSIWANGLQQEAKANCLNVLHGDIKEVSLVVAGANPGARIESVIRHGEECDDEFFMSTGDPVEFYHAEEETKKNTTDGRTVQDILDEMTEEQRNAALYMVAQALKVKDDEEDNDMKQNAFESAENKNTLMHTDMKAVMEDFKHGGLFSEAYLAHAVTDENGVPVEYGIADIDYLFPDAKNYTTEPQFIKRNTDWVDVFMNGVHHTPFSRIKTMFVDITMDEARARGYMKGNLKYEEVVALLKRTTTPQTIYKKQKLDRDDIKDITDFDTVAFMKKEMRGQLNEEVARAGLIGDGRTAADDNKIDPLHIRPIWTDDDFYSIKQAVTVTAGATDDEIAKKFIRQAVKARKDYKGSGNPILFTTEDILTDCLLMEDSVGRVIYDTEEKLRTALRVTKIVTVPLMENQTRTDTDGNTRTLMGIIVNLNDYNIGADKGGGIDMFEDFDIDYNQQKYLIETRCSGALTKPKSAIVLEKIVTEA